MLNYVHTIKNIKGKSWKLWAGSSWAAASTCVGWKMNPHLASENSARTYNNLYAPKFQPPAPAHVLATDYRITSNGGRRRMPGSAAPILEAMHLVFCSLVLPKNDNYHGFDKPNRLGMTQWSYLALLMKFEHSFSICSIVGTSSAQDRFFLCIQGE